MEDWKNTKCGTCLIQRKKPICNSCMRYSFYRPMTNADRIRNMSNSELAHFLEDIDKFWNEGDLECCVRINGTTIHDDYIRILEWLQSEAE